MQYYLYTYEQTLFQIASIGNTNATKPCCFSAWAVESLPSQTALAAKPLQLEHFLCRVDVTDMQGNKCLNVSEKQLFHHVKKRSLNRW